MTPISILRSTAGALAVLLLAACANDPANLTPGVTRERALQQLGPPTSTYPLDSGERLQYSRAPLGFQVTNVDVNAAGRVFSVRQEMDEGLFDSTIKPGVWREADMLRSYGRPYEVTRIFSFNGTVWTWRYKHINDDRFLYVYLDPNGTVDHWNVGDDFVNGPSFRAR